MIRLYRVCIFTIYVIIHNYVFSTENVLLFQFFLNSLIIQHHVIWYDACPNQHILVYNQKSIYMRKKSFINQHPCA